MNNLIFSESDLNIFFLTLKVTQWCSSDLCLLHWWLVTQQIEEDRRKTTDSEKVMGLIPLASWGLSVCSCLCRHFHCLLGAVDFSEQNKYECEKRNYIQYINMEFCKVFFILFFLPTE